MNRPMFDPDDNRELRGLESQRMPVARVPLPPLAVLREDDRYAALVAAVAVVAEARERAHETLDAALDEPSYAELEAAHIARHDRAAATGEEVADPAPDPYAHRARMRVLTSTAVRARRALQTALDAQDAEASKPEVLTAIRDYFAGQQAAATATMTEALDALQTAMTQAEHATGTVRALDVRRLDADSDDHRVRGVAQALDRDRLDPLYASHPAESRRLHTVQTARESIASAVSYVAETARLVNPDPLEDPAIVATLAKHREELRRSDAARQELERAANDKWLASIARNQEREQDDRAARERFVRRQAEQEGAA